jgi:hypothetical protein
MPTRSGRPRARMDGYNYKEALQEVIWTCFRNGASSEWVLSTVKEEIAEHEAVLAVNKQAVVSGD